MEAQLVVAQMIDKRQFKVGIIDVIASPKEFLPASECVGRISADFKSPCPPGYPILIYGEVIQKEHVKLIGANTQIKVVCE